MSIFFSPDEPKYIDSHSGRMTRLVKTPRTFSRQKDNTLIEKGQYATKTRQVVPEISELKAIREAYEVFIEMFALFNKQNGPAITGSYMSNNFLHFKAAFEPFILHAKHYFNSSAHSQNVRRFSPLLQFSAKLLREWAILVSTMNKLAQSEILPHLHELQLDFEGLSNDVSSISSAFVNRTYYRDNLYASSNYLKHKISSSYQEVYDVIAGEGQHGFNRRQLSQLQSQMVLLSRDINENFLGMLPSSATMTPEMTRQKTHMKAAVGNIVALIEAAFYFRGRIAKVLEQMSILHMSICSMLDRLGIRYEIEVQPLCSESGYESEPEVAIGKSEESAEKRAENFVNDISHMLEIDLDGVHDPIERMDTVQRALKERLAGTTRLSKVEMPPSKTFSAPKTTRRSKLSMSQTVVAKRPASARREKKEKEKSMASTVQLDASTNE